MMMVMKMTCVVGVLAAIITPVFAIKMMLYQKMKHKRKNPMNYPAGVLNRLICGLVNLKCLYANLIRL